MNEVFRTLIVPASVAQPARALAAALSPAAAGMWVRGCYAPGENEPSYYINSGLIGADFADLLPLQDHETGELLSAGHPDVLAAMAAQAGIDVTAEQIDAIFAVADVTLQDGHAAMARLGVQLVRADE
jgi:hypothetical protein